MSAERFVKMELGDEGRLEAFLAQFVETSMFLRSNLANHGLGPSKHAHATTFFARETQGAITGVIGVTKGGFGMVQAPENPAALAHCLMGHRLSGMTGDAQQIGDVVAALGFDEGAFSLLEDEPLMSVLIADSPEAQAHLRSPRTEDLDLLVEWLAQYEIDTGLARSWTKAQAQGEKRARTALKDPSFRIAEDQDQPVGMTTVNARVHDVIQIGGVYVPKEHRGRGIAQRMVGAQLHEARLETGATRAILFANNPTAQRVYERLGFTVLGSYRVALLKEPRVLTS